MVDPQVSTNPLRAKLNAALTRQDFDGALPFAQELVGILEVEGSGAAELAVALHSLATISFERGDIEAAMEPLTRSVELFSDLGDEQARNRSAAVLTMAEITRAVDDYGSAASLFRRVLTDLQGISAASPDDAVWLNVVYARALYGLGGCQISTGDKIAAAASLDACEVAFEAAYGSAPDLLAQVRSDLAGARALLGSSNGR